MVEDGEILDGFLHALTAAREIFLLVAGVGLVAQQLLRIFGVLLQIAQVVHVGIEAHPADEIGSHAHRHNGGYDDKQRFLTVEGVGVHAVDEPEGASC